MLKRIPQSTLDEYYDRAPDTSEGARAENEWAFSVCYVPCWQELWLWPDSEKTTFSEFAMS